MNHKQDSSRRDHLTLTTEQGKIELKEEQLDRVTGGVGVVTGVQFKYDHKID